MIWQKSLAREDCKSRKLPPCIHCTMVESRRIWKRKEVRSSWLNDRKSSWKLKNIFNGIFKFSSRSFLIEFSWWKFEVNGEIWNRRGRLWKLLLEKLWLLLWFDDNIEWHEKNVQSKTLELANLNRLLQV